MSPKGWMSGVYTSPFGPSAVTQRVRHDLKSHCVETRNYTVLSGTRALWEGSIWPLAVPVGLASVVLPFCLIIVLLSLTMAAGSGLPAAIVSASAAGSPRPRSG